MTQAQHTPTPWESRYSNITAGDKLIGTLSSGFSAPTPSEAEANAAFIVKAVNCHDELVEALVHTVEALVHANALLKQLRNIDLIPGIKGAFAMYDAALARAKGE